MSTALCAASVLRQGVLRRRARAYATTPQHARRPVPGAEAESNVARLWRRQGSRPPISALDDGGAQLIEQRLEAANRQPLARHLRFPLKAGQGTAAVLLALCTVDGQPSILFEQRSNRLAQHGGEVCFPGGKADEVSDGGVLERTALRETHEELGLDPARVRVLGALPWVPNRQGTLRVYPVVGWVPGDLGMDALRVCSDEVQRVFALPLEHFYSVENREAARFRGGGTLVPCYASDQKGLSIWGLTAFILHEFLSRVSSD
ncbi:nudix (nucleoside diphosphate linked moiety X)-type motif 8 [Coemansia sp. Benny D115]|nr:nudix (nucleoside diphosphate linked moiety X)-type motif 8 [Coemansia sp. Benny D115]